MSEEKEKKEELEKVGTSNTEKFEAEQNLLGIFAIFLAVDKRINPQNYNNDGKLKI